MLVGDGKGKEHAVNRAIKGENAIRKLNLTIKFAFVPFAAQPLNLVASPTGTHKVAYLKPLGQRINLTYPPLFFVDLSRFSEPVAPI